MKNYLTKIALLFTVASLLIISCSHEETIKQNPVAARPTVPIKNGLVQIGTQVWMTKNLNVSRYRNGDLIPQVTDPAVWAQLTTGAWCYYENNTANGAVYGKLYNWYAVNDPRGLAPTGYRVSSDTEWTTLTDFLGGESVAGREMKATTGWIPFVGINNTNSIGFTALPGSFRNYDGLFLGIGGNGLWWSSTETENTPEFALHRGMFYDNDRADRMTNRKVNGYSVRCIKD
jgi:uncharacterized protein (TIGR02145 family)